MRVKLEEVCKRIYAGGDVPKDRYSTERTDKYCVPIYANAEKDAGLYGYTDEARETELSITVAARGTIGYAAIRKEPFLPVVRLITVVPDLTKVSERYLFYALRNCKPQSSGTSIPQLTVPDIKKNYLNLLELPEQERIADRLDQIKHIIELREEEIKELDNLIKARFVELFGDPIINPKGWKRCKFGDVVFYQEGPGVRNWQFRDSGVKLINIRNVINDSLDLSNTNNYLEIDEVETKYKHFLLNEGDYVMASSGVTWGKIAEVYKEHLPLCLNTSMIRIRPIDSNVICKKYLFHFIKSDGFRKQITRLITGSAQPNFGPSHLAKIDILVPDIELQQKFSLFTEQVDKSKVVVQKALNEAQTLFNSLMQEYFG